MNLSEANSSSPSLLEEDASFVTAKELYISWEGVSQVTWDVVNTCYDNYIFGPINQIISEEYAPLKMKIAERRNIVLDYDSRKGKLDLLNRNGGDSEKIQRWEEKVARDDVSLKEITYYINDRIDMVILATKTIVEEALVASFAINKFLLQQVQLKTADKMQNITKKDLLAQVEGEVTLLQVDSPLD
jgi:hypothetical protein